MQHESLADLTVTDRPLRADAQRNRDKLLAAATEAFAADGEDAALEAVAERAGVGIGTLYRHFPNRDALVVAAYQHEVDALCVAAADYLAAQPADEALRAWTQRFADYVATKRRMGNALRSAAASDSPLFASTRERIIGALRLLLEAGAASGTLRSDVEPKDVLRVINGIWYLPDGPQWREDVGRMLQLVIDGLRYGVPDRAAAVAQPLMDGTPAGQRRPAAWLNEPFLYLTTVGRRTGRAHRIEIWFGARGGRLYLLAGSRERADWVRNLQANAQVTVELGDESHVGLARLLEAGAAEDQLARELLLAKYSGSEDDLDEWGRTSLAVVVAFPAEAS